MVVECPAHDWLNEHRIPSVHDMNEADEAVCKLPPKLPDMAIYDVRKEYGFTADEVNLMLTPVYTEFTKTTTDEPYIESGLTCASETDVNSNIFTWVSWYESTKEHEKNRGWIIEDTLICQTVEADNPQVKRPAVAIPFPNLNVPPPLTHFGDLTDTEFHSGGDTFPDIRQKLNDVDNMLDHIDDMLDDLENPDNNFGFGGFTADCNMTAERVDCKDLQSKANCANGCWEEEKQRTWSPSNAKIADKFKKYKVKVCATKIGANICQHIHSHICFLNIVCNWAKNEKGEIYYEDCAAHFISPYRRTDENDDVTTDCGFFLVTYDEKEDKTTCSLVVTATYDTAYSKQDEDLDADECHYKYYMDGVVLCCYGDDNYNTHLEWCGYDECDEC